MTTEQFDVMSIFNGHQDDLLLVSYSTNVPIYDRASKPLTTAEVKSGMEIIVGEPETGLDYTLGVNIVFPKGTRLGGLTFQRPWIMSNGTIPSNQTLEEAMARLEAKYKNLGLKQSGANDRLFYSDDLYFLAIQKKSEMVCPIPQLDIK